MAMTRYEFALFVWLRNPLRTIWAEERRQDRKRVMRLTCTWLPPAAFSAPQPEVLREPMGSTASSSFTCRPVPRSAWNSAFSGGCGVVCTKAALQVNGAREITQLSCVFFWASGQSKGTSCTLSCPTSVEKLLPPYCSSILSRGGSLHVPATHRSQPLMPKTVFKGNINSLIFKVHWMHNIYT